MGNVLLHGTQLILNESIISLPNIRPYVSVCTGPIPEDWTLRQLSLLLSLHWCILNHTKTASFHVGFISSFRRDSPPSNRG